MTWQPEAGGLPEPSGIAFLVDENLLRKGRALNTLRSDIVIFGEGPVSDLVPTGALDSEWIPVVGAAGWVVMTNDHRIRTRPIEARLAQEHRLKVVHLHGAVGHQRPWAQAVRLMSRWSGIEAHIAAQPEGPWWLSVRRDKVRAMRFEPGAVERA